MADELKNAPETVIKDLPEIGSDVEELAAGVPPKPNAAPAPKIINTSGGYTNAQS